jgi:hypothetical protein
MLDYFARERDLRGYDATRGWMHSVAHTADAFKFLARIPVAPANSRGCSTPCGPRSRRRTVFVWGENDRLAGRCTRRGRADADPPRSSVDALGGAQGAVGRWTRSTRPFARLENAKQILRASRRFCRWNSADAPEDVLPPHRPRRMR